MKFLIVTHTPHFLQEGQVFAYSPYVREMNMWLNHVTHTEVIAPVRKESPGAIHQPYLHNELSVAAIPAISLTRFTECLRTLFWFPWILIKMMAAMRRADHIHLRCPGSIGLMGCLAQVFFPKKTKTAKYAGNWDPKAQQPRSYRFQKWVLSNTFWTKNMQVLVYGDWPDQSDNIKPFFTATYPESKADKPIPERVNPPFRFLFVGSLAPGKQPVYAAQLVAGLRARGYDCHLDFYGEGTQRGALEDLQNSQPNHSWMTLHGNQNAETVEKAYMHSDFLVLASKSEGWPKVLAEAMFWGVIPASTRVSCVPWMLGGGARGIVLSLLLEEDLKQLATILENKQKRSQMITDGQNWSRQYTLDRFENEIKKLL